MDRYPTLRGPVLFQSTAASGAEKVPLAAELNETRKVALNPDKIRGDIQPSVFLDIAGDQSGPIVNLPSALPLLGIIWSGGY